jgi:hypothetical protein
MKVGIMQPYFCPYIGYISLIKHTDKFVLFDTVQFIRHGWIERNRVLKQSGGSLYIKIPLVKHTRDTLIKDIKIRTTEEWKSKILSQLSFYKKKAKYYNETISVIKSVFNNEYDSIVKLNKDFLIAICDYLNIDYDIEIFSEMCLEIDEVNAPDEWALNICKSMGNVTEYWNPTGGISFFDRTKYELNNIDLKFQKVVLPEYDQRVDTFESGLSIIDVMMFNSPKEINNMLDNYSFL